MLWLVLIFCGMLALPSLLCCLSGGWLLVLGLPALCCWLVLGWWVLAAWLEWRRHRNGEDYDDYV